MRSATALPVPSPGDEVRWVGEHQIEFSEYRASEKQRRFQRVFLARSDAGRRLSTFVALGANRSGKSIVAGRLCFAKHLRDFARNGGWYWTVGQTLDRSIGGCQRELWQALPRRMFGEQSWDEKIGFGMHRKVTLRTLDGGKCLVEFRSADQDPSTFEQAALDGVWCDERLPEAIYDRLLPRLIDRDGFLLYSDIPEQWWQYERLMQAQPSAGVYFQHFAMLDNASNLPDGAIDRASAQMTDDERRLRILGEFVTMEGLVYKEFTDAHVVEPFPIPDEWPRWRAIDYGGSAPTACIWLAISPNETAYVYREHYVPGKSIQDQAPMILSASGDERYVQTYLDPVAWSNTAASYGNDIAKQYASAGLRCTPWPRVNEMGEHAMVQRVKKRLEQRQLRVFRPCTNTIREFRSWKYKTDKDGKPVASDTFAAGNNHALDCIKALCCVNACYASGEGGGVSVFSGSGKAKPAVAMY